MNTTFRRFFTVLIIFIPFLLHSCKQKGQTQTLILPIEAVNRPDTVIYGERYVLFGQDSAVCILKNNSWRKVIYTTTILDGNIHYKIFDTAENLREIAYARYIPLAFDSVDYSCTMFPYPDSVVRYYNNGMVKQSGYAEYDDENYQYAIGPFEVRYSEYDLTGILTEKITRTCYGLSCFIAESYYHNGQIKEKWIQGESFISGACLGATEWDSLGNKTKEHKYDYKMQKKDWKSYNNRFGVKTTIEYYPNGKIKQISKMKSFVESEECPCGQWIYYDEQGNKIRSEQHKPCWNFEIDCEYE